MSHSVYLSIDLDYWDGQPGNEKKAEAFMRRVIQLERPITCCLSHEQLLPSIRESRCSEVWNVDAHSDLVRRRRGEKISCGTWASFVHGRRRKTYTWFAPRGEIEGGRCDRQPYASFDLVDPVYHRISVIEGLPDDLSRVRAIGVCASPDYWHYPTVARIWEALLRPDVPGSFCIQWDAEWTGADADVLAKALPPWRALVGPRSLDFGPWGRR